MKQSINGFTVQVIKNRTNGVRAALVNGVDLVPLEMCMLAAGRDAWMKNIVAKCSNCDTRVRVGDMEGGLLCHKCFDEAGEENARLDGRI